MRALTLVLAIAVIGAPLAAFIAVVRASAKQRGHGAGWLGGTLALGAIAFVLARLMEQRIAAWGCVDARPSAAFGPIGLVYVFAVAAPLEQGLKVAAIAPAWRLLRPETRADGVALASASALGFVCARNTALLFGHIASPLDVARAVLAIPAHVFFAGAWGWALGRDAAMSSSRGPLGGNAFNAAWLVATLLNGAYDDIVYARGRTALIAAVPILLVMAATVYIAWPGVRRDRGASPLVRAAHRRLLDQLAPPSIDAIRAALWRTERPVTLSWISLGAVVTAGVVTTSLAAAVATGRAIGVDFAAVDRSDASEAAAIAPLLVLGSAALAAFPFAGWLIARASSTRTVLEPAISAGLAIAGGLFLLGLAAPIAVVFALAVAPVAFGLACAGAWLGMAR